jgi:hypothetical protein
MDKTSHRVTAVDGVCTHPFPLALALLVVVVDDGVGGEDDFAVAGGGKSRGWCRVETMVFLDVKESQWTVTEADVV